MAQQGEKKIVLQTAGFDARFPNQNQTKHWYVHGVATECQECQEWMDTDPSWQNYVDYHKCVNAKGEDFAPCQQFKKAFRALCPNEWVGRWDEQIENGIFPASLEP